MYLILYVKQYHNCTTGLGINIFVSISSFANHGAFRQAVKGQPRFHCAILIYDSLVLYVSYTTPGRELSGVDALLSPLDSPAPLKDSFDRPIWTLCSLLSSLASSHVLCLGGVVKSTSGLLVSP
jgi:hypothetical protein